jgi:hypothetical protein
MLDRFDAAGTPVDTVMALMIATLGIWLFVTLRECCRLRHENARLHRQRRHRKGTV